MQNLETNLKPIFIGTKELAFMLNEVQGTIYNAKSKGLFPSKQYPFRLIKRGRKSVFLLEEIEAWVKSEFSSTITENQRSEMEGSSNSTSSKRGRGRPRKTSVSPQSANL